MEGVGKDLLERNRAIAVRWMEEIWNQRREEVVDELMDPDAVGHMEGGDASGPAAFKVVHTAFLTALPDLRIFVEDSVAEGDSVVLRWRVTGTHQGRGLGVAPTGRQVAIRGMSWFRLANGKLVEGWDTWNHGGMMQQLVTP